MIYKMLSLASPRAKWAMLAEIKVMPNPQYANSFILSGTISEFTRVGPGPRWLDGPLGASNSSAPFRNRSEAFDTAWPSQRLRNGADEWDVPRVPLSRRGCGPTCI